jgi:predicted transcriptional regulator
MQKDISTLLQEISSATGLSQPAIAARIGTSQPTVNRIIRGQADCKASTLRAIERLHQETFPDGAPLAVVSATSRAPELQGQAT